MQKIFSPADWQDLPGEDTQIKIASGGLAGQDKLDALRVASPEIVDWISKVATHPDNYYVHKFAMGGSNTYGPNRWGDGFRESILRRDVPTFELHGKAYRNHKSKGPYYGKVAAARFREDLNCVELVTEYYGCPKTAAAGGGRVADLELTSLRTKGSIPVSMGSWVPGDSCLPSWGTIQTVDGIKLVPEIQVGDLVLTHKGEYRRVTDLIRTPAAGKRVVAIRAAGYPDTLDVTDNHPVWVVKQAQVRYSGGHLRPRPDFSPAFIDAGQVAVGDYLVRHVQTFTGQKPIANELAYLLGQYLGDGCLEDTGKSNCVSLTTCQTDTDIVARIEECCLLLGLEYRIDPPKKGAVRIRIRNRERGNSWFVDRCREFCGKTDGKYLRPASFDWSCENAMAFLGGYVDADGSYDADRQNCRFGSVLPRLAASVQELCLAVGIVACVQQQSQEDAMWAASEFYYCGSIGIQDTAKLVGLACRVREGGISQKPSLNIFFELDGAKYLATRVMDIREVVYTDDTVYNFSVDSHETYTAYGFVVHNCVICNNWSPTRDSYCTSTKEGGMCPLFGCKNGMLKVAEDGRLQHVDNPKNTFYDISMVQLGADPCANGFLLPIGKFASFGDESLIDHWAMESKIAAWAIDDSELETASLNPTMVKLAYVLAEIEQQQAMLPSGELDGGLKVASYMDCTNLHAPSAVKRAQAIRDLAAAKVFPNFRSYAKSAGLSDGMVDEMIPLVGSTFQTLRAQRQAPRLIKLADFPKNLSTNFVNRLNSCNDFSLEQPTIVRRSLESAANERQFSVVRTAKVGSALPEIVVKYAAAKLAWLSEVQPVDMWHLVALQRRDLIL